MTSAATVAVRCAKSNLPVKKEREIKIRTLLFSSTTAHTRKIFDPELIGVGHEALAWFEFTRWRRGTQVVVEGATVDVVPFQARDLAG